MVAVCLPLAGGNGSPVARSGRRSRRTPHDSPV